MVYQPTTERDAIGYVCMSVYINYIEIYIVCVLACMCVCLFARMFVCV